jgi:hypothetical protein
VSAAKKRTSVKRKQPPLRLDFHEVASLLCYGAERVNAIRARIETKGDTPDNVLERLQQLAGDVNAAALELTQIEIDWRMP